MAGSRLTSFGTIFTRMTGLLESGAIKEVPLWYNVYKKFPPECEPFVDRPIPPQDQPIPELVYEEDFDRVKRSKVTTIQVKKKEVAYSRRFEQDPLKQIAKALGEK